MTGPSPSTVSVRATWLASRSIGRCCSGAGSRAARGQAMRPRPKRPYSPCARSCRSSSPRLRRRRLMSDQLHRSRTDRLPCSTALAVLWGQPRRRPPAPSLAPFLPRPPLAQPQPRACHFWALLGTAAVRRCCMASTVDLWRSLRLHLRPPVADHWWTVRCSELRLRRVPSLWWGACRGISMPPAVA